RRCLGEEMGADLLLDGAPFGVVGSGVDAAGVAHRLQLLQAAACHGQEVGVAAHGRAVPVTGPVAEPVAGSAAEAAGSPRLPRSSPSSSGSNASAANRVRRRSTS